MIKIYSEDLGRVIECKADTSLKELLEQSGIKHKWPVLAAIVNNQLKELGYKVYNSKNVRFIDYTHPDGFRTYARSLNFVLQKAVSELYPQHSLTIEYNLQNGMYAEIRELEPDEEGSPIIVSLSEEEIGTIKCRMEEIVAADYPITREKIPTEEAVKLFRANNRPQKALLHELRGKFFCSVYYLNGYADHFYGPLVYSTGVLTHWDIESFSRGLLLRSPSGVNPTEIVKMPYQYKLFDVFKEYSNWCNILGVKGVGSLNEAILKDKGKALIQIAEALHEKKYGMIADEIYKDRERLKLVLIAGPSSSGKTSTSKRLALQTKVLGLNPVIIEMDNYFVDRDKTPRDSKGNFDFESLKALDTDFLSRQINDLFAGKTIELPKFDFAQGKRIFHGSRLSLGEKDVLIMEGIHALNPELSAHMDKEKIFRVYASALTSMSLDENNNISTSDSRLIRRIVRDWNYRGVSPEETILRWASVRRGEVENIFPYQENADVVFNSALIYELPLLKYYAEPLLRRIPANSPASIESIRLLKFLSYIQQLQPAEIACVPPTSIIREFIGGSSFDY